MKKQDVIKHFGTQLAVAKALGVSAAAVSKWPGLIPELQAMKLERITDGKLKYNPELYLHRDNAA